MKRKIINTFALLLLVIGLLLLPYPAVSNYIYENRQKELVTYYEQTQKQLPEETLHEQWQECWDYNKALISGGVLLTDPFDDTQLDPTSHPYVDLLNLHGDGMMGSLEIPAIDVYLAIYHGTQEDVLQEGVGHLQGTSLPVGGTSSHCVLSAHSGLSNKRLFTDLEQLQEGDVFYLHILGEVLAYEVDQIKVVEPEDTSDLQIHADEDYVTLVTCTPYGINSHRLLVRGTRIPYEAAKTIEDTTSVRNGTWQRAYIQAFLLGGMVIIIFVIGGILYKKKQQKR